MEFYKNLTGEHGPGTTGANRFADNNELRYSIRSLYKFAPWVRNIYLLTNGQIPRWLNIDHPRIKVLTHAQIFQNQSHLPTFSSPAIEANMHNIQHQGLSEHYLYFNDDVMLGRPVQPEDFISSVGFKIIYDLWWSASHCNSYTDNMMWAHSMCHTNEVFSSVWGKAKRWAIQHVPLLINRTILKNLYSR